MSTIPYFHVDSFASTVFQGNPAGVCLLSDWLPDETMRSIAAENRHSETAFIVPDGSSFQIRWFSPAVEVALCGHATLAAGAVLFMRRRIAGPIQFLSQSGPLVVEKKGDVFWLDFPAASPRPIVKPASLEAALGVPVSEVLEGRFLVAVVDSEETVQRIQPDYAVLCTLPGFGVTVTAPGRDHDYVLRCFGPKAGIPEDPVTGSAQCDLVPYWSARLGKNRLRVAQRSERGGELDCESHGDRVKIGGRAAIYLQGEISL